MVSGREEVVEHDGQGELKAGQKDGVEHTLAPGRSSTVRPVRPQISAVRGIISSSRERGANMIRPVTSSVSALSGFVANGHQALHYVSSSPSKIPYGGFSPVRLQTGYSTATFADGTPSAYMRPTVHGSPSTPSGPRGQVSAGGVVHLDLQSRGPWLASGLCCPARSSLTMASSEPLGLSRRLMLLRRRVFASSAEAERFPNLLCVSVLSVPSPVPRRTGRLHPTVASPPVLAFAHLCTGSASAVLHASRFTRGLRNEAATFALCYGPESCLPFTDKDFYIRAFVPGVTSRRRRV